MAQQAELDAVVGLGGNLGDPVAAFLAALAELEARAVVSAVSPLYRTAPVGGPPQPDFHNAAVRVGFDGAAIELLDLLLSIEQSLGRTRPEHWGPRILDLDLLWIAGLCVAEPRLTVPHPHLLQRAFALVPLLSLVPGAIHPGSGRPLATAAAELEPAELQVLHDPRWEAVQAARVAPAAPGNC